MEMLIVIAIIAVLVTILVPTISTTLRKAREAADVANLRAAYATYQIAVIEDSVKPTFTITDDGLLTVTSLSGYFQAKLNYHVIGDGATPMSTAANIYSVTYVPKQINDGTPYTWELAEYQ